MNLYVALPKSWEIFVFVNKFLSQSMIVFFVLFEELGPV